MTDTAPVAHLAHAAWTGDAVLSDDARAVLIGPGAPFEMRTEKVLGQDVTVFANRAQNLRRLFDASVDRFRDLTLVADERQLTSWTFAEVREQVDSLAALLAERYSVRKGDRVAVVAANSPAYGFLMWATLSLGAIVTSLNGWWVGPELQYGIELTTPVIVAGDRQRLDRLPEGAVPAGTPVVLLDDLLAQAQALGARGRLRRPAVEIAEDDPAVILFTSGTTGRPKGATLSHRNIVNFTQAQQLRGVIGRVLAGEPPAAALEPPAGHQPATIVASPMFHISGLVAVIMSGPILGAKLVFPPPGRFDPAQQLRLTQQHRLSMWSGVPTQFWRVLRCPDFDDYDLSSLQSIGAGGAPFAPELVHVLQERLPWVVLSNGYGMSETVGLGTSIGGDAIVAMPDSVGAPAAGVEVEIRDADGAVVRDDEVGEIHLKTASVFLGYWDDPRATAAALDEHRWYRTGDFGRLRDGFLYLESRMRDLIIRGGENIYPLEIEHRLVEHPDIDDAAVIGVDHPELGQEVKAFVVCPPGRELSAAEVRAWVAEALAPFKVPAHVELRSSLPYTETGKLLKHELEREERDRPG
ncbi:MAG TPA: class I adenylate-forming enzyme family protein [Acidimicrobiia bacterium]|nr:class I adenylate-forming enzyme family protein [Acidimicrobiia bacterium]